MRASSSTACRWARPTPVSEADYTSDGYEVAVISPTTGTIARRGGREQRCRHRHQRAQHRQPQRRKDRRRHGRGDGEGICLHPPAHQLSRRDAGRRLPGGHQRYGYHRGRGCVRQSDLQAQGWRDHHHQRHPGWHGPTTVARARLQRERLRDDVHARQRRDHRRRNRAGGVHEPPRRRQPEDHQGSGRQRRRRAERSDRV